MIQYLNDLLKNSLNEIIIQLGLSEVFVEILVRVGLILLLLLGCWIAHQIVQGPLMRSFERISRLTNQQWDNTLVEKRFLQRLLYFIPLIILYIFIPQILEGTAVYTLSIALVNILLLIAGMMTLDALLNSILVIYENSSISKDI